MGCVKVSIFAVVNFKLCRMDFDMYFFNPENDMALANFTPYYKAPGEIVRMQHDLELLPVWYAAPGSVVKVDDEELAKGFVCSLVQKGMQVSVSVSSDWLQTEYLPWGWSPSFSFQLKEKGIEVEYLPTEAELQMYRRYSSREWAMEVLRRFQGVKGVCGESWKCLTLGEVESLLSSHPEVVLKSPWSGSGRGVTRCAAGDWNDSLQGWVKRVLRTQGFIMVEPFYDKVCDFAMEYYSDGQGHISFVGYSLFETDSHGNYKANQLLSDDAIIGQIGKFVKEETLAVVNSQLQHLFSVALGQCYRGYLGVDMMICRQMGRYLLHPCVEINLRMNMGVVSRLFFDRWMEVGSRGKYMIEHYFADEEAVAFHELMQQKYPLQCEKGKVAKGYLSLTPVTPATRYQVYVLVG